jgi:hypothetical protein
MQQKQLRRKVFRKRSFLLFIRLLVFGFFIIKLLLIRIIFFLLPMRSAYKRWNFLPT